MRTRRRVLAGIGTAIGGIALAGCTDSSDDSDPSGDSEGPDDSDDSGDSDATGDGDGDRDRDGDDSDSDDSDSSEDPDETEPGCEGETVHESYEEIEVTIGAADGEELGSVTAAIADTDETRQIGLSETECLPEDRGMLFVYSEMQSLNFWMIDMDFGIDIVYIDNDGVITSIHHAEAPADDESGTEEHHQYAGEGQYVLEVNYEWTTDRGIEAGDVVTFEQ